MGGVDEEAQLGGSAAARKRKRGEPPHPPCTGRLPAAWARQVAAKSGCSERPSSGQQQVEFSAAPAGIDGKGKPAGANTGGANATCRHPQTQRFQPPQRPHSPHELRANPCEERAQGRQRKRGGAAALGAGKGGEGDGGRRASATAVRAACSANPLAPAGQGGCTHPTWPTSPPAATTAAHVSREAVWPVFAPQRYPLRSINHLQGSPLPRRERNGNSGPPRSLHWGSGPKVN